MARLVDHKKLSKKRRCKEVLSKIDGQIINTTFIESFRFGGKRGKDGGTSGFIEVGEVACQCLDDILWCMLAKCVDQMCLFPFTGDTVSQYLKKES